jgi:hypothetical protein
MFNVFSAPLTLAPSPHWGRGDKREVLLIIKFIPRVSFRSRWG